MCGGILWGSILLTVPRQVRYFKERGKAEAFIRELAPRSSLAPLEEKSLLGSFGDFLGARDKYLPLLRQILLRTQSCRHGFIDVTVVFDLLTSLFIQLEI